MKSCASPTQIRHGTVRGRGTPAPNTTMLATGKYGGQDRKCDRSVSFKRSRERSETASIVSNGVSNKLGADGQRRASKTRADPAHLSCHKVVHCSAQGGRLCLYLSYILDSANSKMSSMSSTSNGPRSRPSPTSLCWGVLTAVQVM